MRKSVTDTGLIIQCAISADMLNLQCHIETEII